MACQRLSVSARPAYSATGRCCASWGWSMPGSGSWHHRQGSARQRSSSKHHNRSSSQCSRHASPGGCRGTCRRSTCWAQGVQPGCRCPGLMTVIECKQQPARSTTTCVAIADPCRGRHRELDEHEAGELQQPKRSRGSSSNRPAATGQQHDDQQYISWDGWRMDTVAVEALLQREPDDPHHMHNIDRCVCCRRLQAWLHACVDRCRSLLPCAGCGT